MTALRAKITIEFTMDDIISLEALNEFYGGRLEGCIRHMFKEDHFIGLVNDKYKILSVEEIA